MSSESVRHTGSNVGNNRQAVAYINAHVEIVTALPGPEYQWAWRDLPEHEDTPTPFPEHVLGRHASLSGKHIIHKVGKRRDNGNEWWVWQVDPDLYRYAEECADDIDAKLPCSPIPHRRGFKTIDADEGIYECGHPECDERYGRGVIEEVFG